MSKHKRWILGTLLLVCATLWTAGFHRAVLQITPGVTRANFERLHCGMKIEEIEAILGKPADFQFAWSFRKSRYWHGDEGTVRITVASVAVNGEFHAKDGQVIQLAWESEPFLEKLRLFFGL